MVNAMCHESYTYWGDPSHKITDGIDITNWKVGQNNEQVTFSVWDFAGQSVYYNTHQVKYCHTGIRKTHSLETSDSFL